MGNSHGATSHHVSPLSPPPFSLSASPSAPLSADGAYCGQIGLGASLWQRRIAKSYISTSIRGRDPMAPLGDGALNLPQQVEAGRGGSWEEEQEEREEEALLYVNTLHPTSFLMSEDLYHFVLL